RQVAATLTRRGLFGTDAVSTPTLKVARLLSGYGVRRPVHVVPTGLDLERFRPATTEAGRADVAALRARLGLGPEQQVVVSVSRLAKEKHLDEVLDHFADLDRPGTVLVLVGD